MTDPLGFDNSYALGMDEARAQALGIDSIDDLRAHPDLRLGFSNEFMQRADGWPGLRTAYRLPQRANGLDHDLAYRGLANGALDVIDLYRTDAEIPRSEEHTSELQSLMRISYAVFCLKKKKQKLPTIYYSALTHATHHNQVTL